MDGTGTPPASSFLTRLSAASRDAVLALGSTVRYPAGRVLMRQGAAGDAVFLLRSGVVKVSSAAENGQEFLLDIRVSGAILGEMAVLGNCPRNATVTTCTPCAICVIAGAAFLDRLGRDAALARQVGVAAAQRLAFANRRRIDSASYDAATAFARILVELTTEAGITPGQEVSLTRAELGALIGVRERTAQKAVHDLQARGLIERRGTRLLIRDPVSLMRFADLAPDRNFAAPSEGRRPRLG